MQEVYEKIDELAEKEVSRKKFLGFGLAVAATAMFSGMLGKARQVSNVRVAPAKEKRLSEIYKTITKVNK